MKSKKINTKKIFTITVATILALVLLLSRTITNFVTNYQWFSKNNFIQTYMTKIKTEAFLIIPVWILITLFLYLYLLKLKKKYYETAKIFFNGHVDKIIHKSMFAFSAFSSIVIAIAVSNTTWLKLKMFLNSNSLDKSDPIFGRDIGFYIFKLPFYEHVLNIIILLTVALSLLTICFFVLIIALKKNSENNIQDINFSVPSKRISSFLSNEIVKEAERKIAYLGLIVLFVIGIKYYFKGFELMYSTRGVVYGASYTDIHVTLILYKIMSILSIISAFIFCFSLLKSKIKIIIAIPALLVSVLLIGNITGFIVQQLIVEPDEISKETEYLEYNIKHTQDAFSLNIINFEEFPVEQTLTWDDLENNSQTIKNIKINDAKPLQQTYNQIQGIRLYYTFSDIDMDRYFINGEYTQVFIAARELEQKNLNDKAQTWLNKHLKYTHGYGIVMSPVNSVTTEGQPELIFKNIPPITDTNLVLNRPEIYFGELHDRYVIINTSEDEFDYPSGSDNETTRYEGEAGIKLSGINRILFSIRESSLKLLFSSVVDSDSKIILYRNIFDRVKAIAPFLEYDKNPYLVLNPDDGKLYWILDAYTTSKFYPYSEMFSFKNKGVNYIRNSVKIVIDAYDGSTTYYLFDEEDPLVLAYDNIFDDLFTSMDDFPQGLLDHIKYPQDYFDLQSEVFKSYHVDNPEVFYNGEDIWDIANEKYIDGIQKVESNYVMFKLPDSDFAEFSLIVPYTPKEKANMTSLLVARNDGDNYGKLYIYRFPKDKTIQGPMMIESRIDQNSEISPQFTLWGQEGSTVLRGNLIVVPIENSLLYVEPIYIQADNPNSLPEMKRVIVAYEDQIVMEETLDKALRKIFNQNPAIAESDNSNLSTELETLLKELNTLFNDTKSNIDEIEKLINELNSITD